MDAKDNVKPVLSVCITSYKRPKELKRCLESIRTLHPEQIEVVVSEDRSPLWMEVKKVVSCYSKSVAFPVRFNCNESNLGYDGNLGKLVSLAEGRYLVFMSDDDIFTADAVDVILEVSRWRDFGVMYSPFFTDFDQISLSRRRYGDDLKFIEPGLRNVSKHIYDAILFSGLVFKTEYIQGYSPKRFLNLNYYQVYLFMSVLYLYGALYVYTPFVICGNDGANGYGTSESSGGNDLLADRTSIFSFPEFHKGLVRTIKIFDEEHGTQCLSDFAREYSLRMYPRLADACRLSSNSLRAYWNAELQVGVPLTWIAWVYYLMIRVFGWRFCDMLFSIPKAITKKSRGQQ